jgi:hypothetical protein
MHTERVRKPVCRTQTDVTVAALYGGHVRLWNARHTAQLRLRQPAQLAHSLHPLAEEGWRRIELPLQFGGRFLLRRNRLLRRGSHRGRRTVRLRRVVTAIRSSLVVVQRLPPS